ncbi:HET-domain-containing protein [Hyaloscypha variabilis F]|uniref:HET-domain-containing protein n=1 Tax=Hyaloscypha variabilis (strain UAMH 11265 / GT02V1 / F) TaxID=1149755 RepID=A0A2J6R2J7_HYAVF|nr:HET-domain-containing protein [Hyaloscypha variabilis F]
MNKETQTNVPLFGSLEKHMNSNAPESGERDNFINRNEPHCFRCGKFTPSNPNQGWEKDEVLLRDLEDVEDGSDCEVCVMLLQGLRAYRDNAMPPDTALPQSFSVRCVPGQSKFLRVREYIEPDPVTLPATANASQQVFGQISFALIPSGPKKEPSAFFGRGGLEFFVKPEDSSAFKHIGIGRPVAEDLSSDQCIGLAKQWMSECERNHPICKRWANSVSLPTRVLDVGSESQPPRLVESLGRTGRYAALSHCWGKAQPLTTTSENLSEHLIAIQLDQLPKTFKEAVLLAQRLDLQYIWIDSLCIIQDSEADWNTESAKMAEVYAGAVVTIAATSANDGREGLFVAKGAWNEAVPFSMANSHGEQTTIYIRSASNDHHVMSKNNLFDAHPLSRRGWVLQERLLSTRILMFTSCELVFDCQTLLWCECGHFPFKTEMSSSKTETEAYAGEAAWCPRRTLRVFTQRLLDILSWARDHPPPLMARTVNSLVQYAENSLTGPREENEAWHWQHIVESYTCRCLTRDEDTLPALSGLAKLLQGRLHDRYLAGLWRRDIHKQLLWSILPSTWSFTTEEFELLQRLPDDKINQLYLPYRPRRTADQAPSWSWASIRGAVWWDAKWLPRGRLVEGLAELVETRCVSATPVNPFGSVDAGGYLVLRAPLAPVRLVQYEVHLRSLLHRCRVVEATCHDPSHQHVENCIQLNSEDWAVLDLPLDSTGPPRAQREFWRVKVAEQSPPHDIVSTDYAAWDRLSTLPQEIATSYTIVYHLLLRMRPGVAAEEQAFERVGLYVKTLPKGETYFAGEMEYVKIF